MFHLPILEDFKHSSRSETMPRHDDLSRPSIYLPSEPGEIDSPRSKIVELPGERATAVNTVLPGEEVAKSRDDIGHFRDPLSELLRSTFYCFQFPV